ncbi:ABC-2 family transporter protein [compost metagenome]
MIRRPNWINPVMEKEIRLRMRTIRSPLSIFAYIIAIGLLALGFAYVSTDGSSGRLNAENSSLLFYFLSCVQLILISFMTPGLTAGVISGEREKQTLNILLTTQQSSATIILSKLFSSISFMLLTVLASMPVYSIVFLYGGVSPWQLLIVFVFYVFVMLILGSVGVLFSTLFKKTVVSVIATYGFVLFIYGFTGMAALFFQALRMGGSNDASGYVLSLNPLGVLLSLLVPDFADSLFRGQMFLQLWHLFVVFYAIVIVVALLLSIRYLRPVLKTRR